MKPMNKENVLFHLKEAAEELLRTVADIESDASYSEAEFFVGMQHLYHHLNTAWNTRETSDSRLDQSTDQDFIEWGAYPKDLPTMGA